MTKERLKLVMPNGRIRHGCTGLVDGNGVFMLLEDADETTRFKFSNEATLISQQAGKIKQLEAEVARLEELTKFKERSLKGAIEQKKTLVLRLSVAALDFADDLSTKKKRMAAYDRLMALGVDIHCREKDEGD